MVTSREGLAIANLIFYFPALFIAVFVATKHGWGRQAGWFFLVALSLARIIGSICGIVAVTSPSQGVIETYVILSSVGLSPLLLAMLGLLQRVHEGMVNGPPISPRIFRFLMVIPVVALILAIVGGVDQSSSDASSISDGQTLTRAAVIILMVFFWMLVVITIFTFFSVRSIYTGEERLLYAVALSAPFLFIRLLYSILANFVTSSSTFSLVSGNVIVEGFMATLEEFLIVILYLSAGLAAQKIARSSPQPVSGAGNGYTSTGSVSDQEMHPTSQQYDSPGVERRQPFERKQVESAHEYRRGGRRGGRRGDRRIQGPIHMLINRFL